MYISAIVIPLCIATVIYLRWRSNRKKKKFPAFGDTIQFTAKRTGLKEWAIYVPDDRAMRRNHRDRHEDNQIKAFSIEPGTCRSCRAVLVEKTILESYRFDWNKYFYSKIRNDG